MIELCNLALRAGRKLLLTGIDARFEPGEFVAIVGPNGIGKTTLLKTIAGLQPAASGRAIVAGLDIGASNGARRARTIAFVTSDDVLPDGLTVRDLVAIGRFAHHRWWEWHERDDDAAAIASALSAVGAAGFAHRAFNTLSSGERQKVWIAMGLAQQTPVLLLDEPTSHLDVRVAHEILALLRRLRDGGKTIVCVLHDLNDAATYADRIALLGEGTLLLTEAPDRVLAGDALERVYGVTMERVRLEDGRIRVFAGGPTASA